MLRQPRLFAALALVPALGLALGVVPAGAQPQLSRFELVPRVGALAPLMDLGTWRLDPDIQVKIELQPAFVAGLTAQYNPAYIPVSFRLAFDLTPLNGRTEAWFAVCEIVTSPECRTIGVDSRFLALTGDVLIRAGEPETSRFYLMVGGGIKRYDFADIACDPEDRLCFALDGFTGDTTQPTLHLGLGFTFRIGPALLEAEAADYMSWHNPPGGVASSGHVQQDILLTLGLRLGVL